MNQKLAWQLAAAALALPVLGALATRRLRWDVGRLFAQAGGSPRVFRAAQLAGLPAPGQRYFRHVRRDGQPTYAAGLPVRLV